MFITPAFAQAAGGGANNTLISLLPFLLIFVILYFLVIRPQQKKVKEHKDMVSSLRRGDTVVTNGGLVGKVTKVASDTEVVVEIAKDVKITVIRNMIQDVRSKGEPANDNK